MDEVRRRDTVLGDKMRRPRWGVPLRFNIRHVSVLHLELLITDLLIQNKRRELRDPDNAKIHLDSLYISQRRLEAGDPRRRGDHRGAYLGDGVRGVFLGELVWVLIAEIIVGCVKHSPSKLLKNALVASGYGLKDTAVSFVAGVLQLGIHAQQSLMSDLASVAHGLGLGGKDDEEDVEGPARISEKPTCRLVAHLLCGKHITLDGHRVNAFVRLELLDRPRTDAGFLVDRAESELRMFTRRPCWNQCFELGPVRKEATWLRLTVLHRITADLVRAVLPTAACTGEACTIGVVEVPMQSLMFEDKAIDADGDIVGWFPLRELHSGGGAAASAGGGAAVRCTGQLKLRLRLEQTVFLLRPESLPAPSPDRSRPSMKRGSTFFQSCAGSDRDNASGDATDDSASELASFSSAASMLEAGRGQVCPDED